MSDFQFWLKNLPKDAQPGIWYPVGSLRDENVKTGLITYNTQALLIPVREKNTEELPNHFLNPTYVQNKSLGKCLQLTWAREGDPIAYEFIDDLLRTNNFTETPVLIFLSKLKVWKDILARNGLNVLNKATGLWGELYICANFKEAEKFWTGPSATDTDFRTHDTVIDVKTSRLKNDIILNVSGLHQFDHPEKTVLIVWLRIDIGTTENSIADLLRKIDKSKINPSVLKDLENLVNSLPYSVVHDMNFVCRDAFVFKKDDLPIITSESLYKLFDKNSSRLSRISYQISASGVPRESIDKLSSIFNP